MMQVSEIKKRFDNIERTVSQAAQAVQSDSGAPQELKECVRQMDQQTDKAKELMQQTQDENQIRDCVDSLEELGDRAKDACERSANVNDQVKSAIMQAHRELSDLKHQLH